MYGIVQLVGRCCTEEFSWNSDTFIPTHTKAYSQLLPELKWQLHFSQPDTKIRGWQILDVNPIFILERKKYIVLILNSPFQSHKVYFITRFLCQDKIFYNEKFHFFFVICCLTWQKQHITSTGLINKSLQMLIQFRCQFDKLEDGLRFTQMGKCLPITSGKRSEASQVIMENVTQNFINYHSQMILKYLY